MQKNLRNDALKTSGIVLRRTNYGEADRIINLITPVGKISAIAKGVRRERSKLAGGIEMFSLSDYVIHFGKGEMGVVTSVRMKEHYGAILRNFERMELAGVILKKINAIDVGEAERPFEITLQCLRALNDGASILIVESWFWLNLMEIMGEGMNLYRDTSGEKRKEGVNYEWSVGDSAFFVNPQGEYGTDEIKLLRLLTTMDLAMISRIKMGEEMPGRIAKLAKIVAKL